MILGQVLTEICNINGEITNFFIGALFLQYEDSKNQFLTYVFDFVEQLSANLSYIDQNVK